MAGLPFVALLVIIELTQVEGAPHICPFCTIAHLSLNEISEINRKGHNE